MKAFSVRLLVLVFLLFPVACARAAGPEPAVERQEVSVTLRPESHLLVGRSRVTFAPGAGKVSFRLAEGASIESVAVSGRKAAFSFQGGMLSLDLPAANRSVTVAVSYRAAFNDPVSRHPAASEEPSYGVNGAITGDGTFLGGGAWWYPVPSRLPGRRITRIEAPLGTEAITAGKRVSRENEGAVTRSVWEEARPVGVLSLCAGPYRIQERRVDGVDLYSYFYPANDPLAARYLDAAARYLALYAELFGPYPFEKFAVVENFFPTGYGFPSFTLLGSSVIRLPFIVDTSLPHEIAHSWWGNGIEPDPAGGNWSEGLVTYLADYLLKERRSRVEARDYRRQLLIDYASLVAPGDDFPLASFESRSDPPSRAIGYGKGAMLFHMVRSRIGDRAFFDALRRVCRDHLYGSASWSDFVRAFSESSGRDQAPFMKQWLTRPGGPRLSLSGVTVSRQGERWTVSGSIVQSPPYFDLEVPLLLERGGGETKEQVAVRGELTRFAISSADLPKRLLLDPDAEVFRILTKGEIPATVNSLKGSSRLVGVMTRNCRASRESFQALLASLSQEGAPLVEEKDLDRRQGHDDLLFCGLPGDRSLLPRLPEGIEVGADAFTVDAAAFTPPDALLMLVLQRPDTGRVVALFHPLSQEAAAQYAPKITHYGKYGYLTFAGGANRQKGNSATSDRGVVVELRQ